MDVGRHAAHDDVLHPRPPARGPGRGCRPSSTFGGGSTEAFEGKSHASLVAAILDRDPTPISTVQPLTPPALDRVVRKCLAKDPDARWQTARDLHDELQWLGESGTQATAASAAVALPKRRGSLTLTGTAAVSVVVGAAAMMVYTALSAPDQQRVTGTCSRVRGRGDAADGGADVVCPVARRATVCVYCQRCTGDTVVCPPLGSADDHAASGHRRSRFAFLAPDGCAIDFFAGGKLLRIDLEGGAPVTLADAPVGRGGTWNEDGVIVFVATAATGLMRVAATGGSPVPATRLTAARGPSMPRKAPCAQTPCHWRSRLATTPGYVPAFRCRRVASSPIAAVAWPPDSSSGWTGPARDWESSERQRMA
jgi:hypothetical protein